MKKFSFLICFIFVHLWVFSTEKTIVLTENKEEFYVVREYVSFFEDTSRNLQLYQVLNQKNFKTVDSNVADFMNLNTKSAYWLRFKVCNYNKEQSGYLIELFDFDIDEISFFLKDQSGVYIENKSGFSFPFQQREIKHKNIVFQFPLEFQDSTTVYMRFYSHKKNVLEPVIRTHNHFYDYSLKEYSFLGFCYGLMLLIILYNFIYYIMLKHNFYLFYVLYTFFMLIFLMTLNGTAFQFIWPNNPGLNLCAGPCSISFALIFLLLFSNFYLKLPENNNILSKIVYFFIILKIILVLPQINSEHSTYFNVFDYFLFQLAFLIGVFQFKSDCKSIRWYIISFICLNISYCINFFEYLGIVKSSFITVNSLNIGLVLQFIFLTVSIAETVRESYKEKNKVLSELLLVTEKNESMRLIELKKQMNPHFIFNALNSILLRIVSDKKEEAMDFLMRFSKLIRKILNSSDKLFVQLSEELETLELYLSIEKSRLGNSFSYEINVDPEIDKDFVEFPSLILQPFAENAIWHGLMPKVGDKLLKINIRKITNILEIEIIDNGIGRDRSFDLIIQKNSNSRGINLVHERLKLIELKFKKRTNLTFSDVLDENNKIAGTRVTITIEI